MARQNRGPAQVALPGTRECALCTQPAASKIQVCTDHEAEIGHMLDPTWPGDPARRIPASIPTYWAQLDPAPGRTGGGQRRAPGFASQPPLSLDAVVMRDPRSRPNAVVPVWFTRLPNGKDDVERPHHEPDGQPRPVEVALANLVLELWTRWGYHGPDLVNGDITTASRRKSPWRATANGCIHHPDLTMVRALSSWLHHHRARICAHRDVAAIHGFLADLLHHLRAACGDREEQPVGRCTAWLPRPMGEQVLCNEWIYPPAPTRDPDRDGEDPVSECDRCGTKYGKLDRYRLKRAQQDGVERHEAAVSSAGR